MAFAIARASNSTLSRSTSTDFTFQRSSAELGQLLSRLQRTLLHADPEREQRIRRSEYERARIEANLEYARTSLTKLEQETLGMLAPARRSEAQSDLTQKRELLELLLDRLEDLHKMAVDDDDDDDDDDEGEDILANITATAPSDTNTPAPPGVTEVQETRTTLVDTSGPEATAAPAKSTETAAQTPSIPSPPTPESAADSAPTQTAQSMRSRTSEPSNPITDSQQPAYATARAALFANRRRPEAAVATTETSTATAEAILDQQAAEREDLADKVYKMAQAMKKQQQSIASSLDMEKDVLGRATEGMERTGRGMDAAKGRMSALTRITEGKGWWARMLLYAWVYGLMVALLLLVFVMPKLRF